MNINPISFKGTFCLEQRDLTDKKLHKIFAKEDEYRMSLEASSYTNPGKLYVHMPHEFDEQMIKMLKKLSVNYERIDERDSLDPNKITSRMVICASGQPRGEFLQKIDAKKLDRELQKDIEMYVGFNAMNGSSIKYNRFKKFLKTNQEIRSPIVYLRKFSDGEIKTHIYDGRHRFAVLRDMGIEKIPVTIDEESLELAKEIGLV